MQRNKEAFVKRDRECFPRANRDHEWSPEFVVREAHGMVVKDIEGNEYLDFATPSAIVGHNHPQIVEAIRADGESFSFQ